MNKKKAQKAGWYDHGKNAMEEEEQLTGCNNAIQFDHFSFR